MSLTKDQNRYPFAYLLIPLGFMISAIGGMMLHGPLYVSMQQVLLPLCIALPITAFLTWQFSKSASFMVGIQTLWFCASISAYTFVSGGFSSYFLPWVIAAFTLAVLVVKGKSRWVFLIGSVVALIALAEVSNTTNFHILSVPELYAPSFKIGNIVLSVLASLCAITARQKALESSLRKSVQINRSTDDIFELLSAVLLRVDEDGTLNRVRGKSLALFGLKQNNLRGAKLTQIFHKDHSENILEKLKDGTGTLTARATHTNGQNQRVAVLFFNVNNNKLVFISPLVEMTRTQHEKNDLSAAQNFLSNMSHELRTPLNAIIGFSDLMRHQLLGPILSDQYLEYANRINFSGTELLNMVDQLLDLSDAKMAGVEKFQAIDMNAIINGIIRLRLAQADEKSIKLATTLPSVPILILGQKSDMRQILLHILTASIEGASGDSEIAIHTHQEGSNLNVTFTSQGSDITESSLNNTKDHYLKNREAYLTTTPESHFSLLSAHALAQYSKHSVTVKQTENDFVEITLSIDVINPPAQDNEILIPELKPVKPKQKPNKPSQKLSKAG